MRKTKKREVMFTMSLIITLLVMTSVFALGVGMPYMEDKELHVYPGEEKDLEFSLQVEIGTGSANVKAVILEGSEIIELVDSSDIYSVVEGVHTPVNYKVTIPSDASIGDSHHVKLEFSSAAGTGGFAFGSAIQQNFDVIVGEKPAPVVAPEEKETTEGNLMFYFMFAIVLIVVVIIFFVIKKKKK